MTTKLQEGKKLTTKDHQVKTQQDEAKKKKKKSVLLYYK